MSCLALKHIRDRNPSYSNRVIEVEEVKVQRIYGKEKVKPGQDEYDGNIP